MARPDPSFRRLVEMFQRGHWDEVASAAEVVSRRLLAVPEHASLAPIPVLMAGWSRGEQGYLPIAIEAIERGLRHLSDPAARRELGDLDAFYLRLVELYLLVGDVPSAREHLHAMGSPDAPVSVRFPAQRFEASIAVARGDDTRAAALLGVAESMAPEADAKDAPLLVAGDRAIWLAATGDPSSAATTAEPMAERFGRRRRRRPRPWQAQHLVSVSAAIARAAARRGDTSLSRTWIDRGAAAVGALADGAERRAIAELAMARASLELALGDVDSAEVAGRAALGTFRRMGMRPAAATTRLVLVAVSQAKGHDASVEPSLRSLVGELVELEQLRSAQQADALRAAVPLSAWAGAGTGAGTPAALST